MTKNNYTKSDNDFNILFLHHSTGNIIYHGGKIPNIIIRKLFHPKAYVPKWFSEYNKANGTNYNIINQFFPKSNPYGWNNYPYDYYNIWVKNAGLQPYMNEPTLEILTKKYNLIILKHCYPVSNIEEDNTPDINSSKKTIANYKLQYEALRQKMNAFPQTKFIIWTGAIQSKNNISPSQATRAKEFFEWVKKEWVKPSDNIYVWDFYELETEGDLYLKENYAQHMNDSHPNKLFARKVAPIFCKKIIEVINHNSMKF